MPVAISIRPLFIVGMYQQCHKQQLEIHSVFTVKPEPENPFDKNAVAVYDGCSRVAYIRRDLSIHLCNFLQHNSSNIKRVLLKPERESKPSVKGPEQFCSLIIDIDEQHLPSLEASLKGTGLFICK